MTSLGRRLQRLEAGGRQSDEMAADHRRFIQQEAIHQMSDDELRLVVEIAKAQQEGRALTSQEMAAGQQAWASALEKVCQKLGFKSLAALNKYCGVA